MRTFVAGGYKFYTLNPGERAPNPYEKGDFGGAYLIWQRKSGLWDVRQFVNGKWTEFTDRQFDTVIKHSTALTSITLHIRTVCIADEH